MSSSSLAISKCFSMVNGAGEGRKLLRVKVAMKAASGDGDEDEDGDAGLVDDEEAWGQ